MDSTESSKIERFVSKGKWHYVLFHGLIGGIFLTPIVYFFVGYFLGGDNSWDTIKLYLFILIFPFEVMGWGLFMWIFIKNDYNNIF
ncbi:MAG: hypothetical protein OCD00_05730 [Colwellia sp.]